jgi:hypothetical protein
MNPPATARRSQEAKRFAMEIRIAGARSVGPCGPLFWSNLEGFMK